MKGLTPRKAMASGMHEAHTSGGSFGVESYESQHGAPEHPDADMSHHPMEDHARAIGHPIHHTKGHLPAQAAPHHGPTHHKGHHDHHTHANGKGVHPGHHKG